MPELLTGLEDLVTDSPLTYLIVFALVAGDAIIPLVPGESAVVAAAVLAGDGRLNVLLVWAAAAAGAFVGDLIGYGIGRGLGRRAVDRWVRGEKGRRRLERAESELNRRGVGLIAAAQFIPGGRNLIMIGSGTLAFPLRRFIPAEAVGVTLWATLQTGLGYAGGRSIDNTLVALGVSVVLALVIGVSLERLDHLRRRRAEAGGA
ncbi:MAG TPA: DedA family protein [Miltoncostaeaceae bacterium]|nr:DedA family protein [Miltoncostaeaceae bacterium]